MIIYFILTGSLSFVAGVLIMDYLNKKVNEEANNYIIELKRQLDFYKKGFGTIPPGSISRFFKNNKALKN